MSPQSAYGPRGWAAVFRPIASIFVGLGLFVILPMVLLPRLGAGIDLRGRMLVALVGTLLAELMLFGFLWRWLKGQSYALVGHPQV